MENEVLNTAAEAVIEEVKTSKDPKVVLVAVGYSIACAVTGIVAYEKLVKPNVSKVKEKIENFKAARAEKKASKPVKEKKVRKGKGEEA